LALAYIEPASKNSLTTASATALKLCTPNYDQTISYKVLHKINSRATPTQICHYKHSLMCYKNFTDPVDVMQINFNQAMSRRQQFFKCNDQSNYKVGKFFLSN
jgi:hypothetical protein